MDNSLVLRSLLFLVFPNCISKYYCVEFTDGLVKSFSGSIFIVKATEAINKTTTVEFRLLINNSTDPGMAHFGEFKILRHINNFTMKSQCYWDENSICYYPNMFKTVEFLDRNVRKNVFWN